MFDKENEDVVEGVTGDAPNTDLESSEKNDMSVLSLREPLG